MTSWNCKILVLWIGTTSCPFKVSLFIQFYFSHESEESLLRHKKSVNKDFFSLLIKFFSCLIWHLPRCVPWRWPIGWQSDLTHICVNMAEEERWCSMRAFCFFFFLFFFFYSIYAFIYLFFGLYMAFIDSSAEELPGNWMRGRQQRAPGWDSNSGLLQPGQSLCTRDTCTTNWAPMTFCLYTMNLMMYISWPM